MVFIDLDTKMENTIRGYLKKIEDCPRLLENKPLLRNKYILSLEKTFGVCVYSQIICQLTRLNIPDDVARRYFIDVVDHMYEMSKALNRKISIYIACCDYFASIKKLIKHPVLVDEEYLYQKEAHADKDALTGLFNKSYFDRELHCEIEKFKRFGSHFSLLMIDVDYFKYINDTYGHVAGDSVLVALSDVLKQIIRSYDRAVRFGGDEFAIILPQTSRQAAAVLAERLRGTVEQHPFQVEDEELERLTISIGIATYPIDALDDAGLIQRADQALYLAKRRRNCSIAYCDYIRPGSAASAQPFKQALS